MLMVTHERANPDEHHDKADHPEQEGTLSLTNTGWFNNLREGHNQPTRKTDGITSRLRLSSGEFLQPQFTSENKSHLVSAQ